MNIQLFPNWFKKISLFGIVVFNFLSGGDAFLSGFKAGSITNDPDKKVTIKTTFFTDFFGSETLRYFSILSILFLILYTLSKEKIEDDYIRHLRLQSYQLAFLIIIVIALLFSIFNLQYKYDINDTMTNFLVLYIIIFAIKKRLV